MTPRHLRVIGPREIFKHFLPSVMSPFSSSEFLLIDPSDATDKFSTLEPDRSITVVVNPSEYEERDIRAIPRPLWLWYLDPISQGDSSVASLAPGLSGQASELFLQRQTFAERLGDDSVDLSIASDEPTRDLLLGRNNAVIMSPPPVNENLRKNPSPMRDDFSIGNFGPRSSYVEAFIEEPRARLDLLGWRDDPGLSGMALVTHVFACSPTIFPQLTYEALLALSCRQTLLSTQIAPRWGLEPGIDFLEVSTPEELIRIGEYLQRSPLATSLLAERGYRKSSLFSASSVWRRVLNFADEI